MIEKYVTNSANLDDNALDDSFNKVLELCVANSYNKVTLNIPTKRHLEDLNNILGASLIKNLKKNNNGEFNGIQITLTTANLEISEWTEDIILSLYPTSKMIDNLNDLKRAKAIIVVPWIDKEREDWIKTWNPEIISGGEIEVDSLNIDPRSEKALFILTDMVNLSSGLTHTSDREKTIQLLRILHKKGINLNPDDMRIWALQNGWNSDASSRLYEIAEGVIRGKKFRTTGQKIWTDKIIDKILGT